MAFPVSPVNGQTTTINGITHVYSSASNSWTRAVAVNSYTSSTAPSNPKVGDIWYDTATDDIYRYTTDGVGFYWLDITGPTVANAVTYLNTSVYANSFSGTSQYLSTPSNAAFSFGTGDFTIEGWINLSSATGAYRSILSIPHSGGQILVRFGNSVTYSSYLQVSMLGTLVSNVYSTNQTQTALLNQWVHFAFTRGSSTCRVFLNGVLQNIGTGGPATSFVSNTFSDSTNITNNATVSIGEEIGNTIPFIGHISNLRIVKGTALYTSNFTVPTAPLTAITNTSLLTCQTIPPADASTNALAVTNVGGVSLALYSAQQSATLSLPVSPTQTILTTATSGTYTVPANVKWLHVRMVGGGGGGGGAGGNGFGGGNAGRGGTSTFGTSLLIAGGGLGGQNYADVAVAGGTALIGGPEAVGVALSGAPSSGGNNPMGNYAGGGSGGVSPFGGAGAGGVVDSSTTFENAIPNTGSGAGGGGSVVTSGSRGGGGGGAGGFIDAIISSPLSSYAYTVGAGGTAGPAGTSGQVGGTGGSGIIIIQEHYNY